MDQFPQEIIDRIVYSLPRNTVGHDQDLYLQQQKKENLLPPFASLSRKWKEAVEGITFENLTIKSIDLTDFKEIVSNNRQDKVKQIKFTTIIPIYSVEQAGFIETCEDQEANHQSFSHSCRLLFEALKSWEEEGFSKPIYLTLSDIYSPVDPSVRTSSQLCQDEIDVFVGRRKDLFAGRFDQSYIRLLGVEGLPLLHRITEFRVERFTRKLAPSVAPQIASKFPNLRNIFWDLVDLDSDQRNSNSRMENRVDFAKALETTSWNSLKSATITLYHECPNNQNKILQPTILPNSQFDPVSAALRYMSETLTTFHLSGTIDPSVFWPASDSSNPKVWHFLKRFVVTFDMTTPSGEWYFIGQTPDPPCFTPAMTYYRQFRTKPNAVYMEPLLLAFAKAAQNMPVLERGAITCPLTDPDQNRLQFEVSYMAAGIPAPYGDVNEEEIKWRRVYYETGHWFPRKEIEYQLLNIGKDVHGDAVLERTLES